VFDVFVWDMGGHDDNVDEIVSKLPHARTIRYLGSHLDMMRRTATRSRTEYFWVVSSCCEYSTFDFNWMPPIGQEHQLHCWATAEEKFGDTFLVHLPSWAQQQSVEKLEWYQHVNYHPVGVPALLWPSLKAKSSDLTEAVRTNPNTSSLYTAYYIDSSIGLPCIGFNKWENKPVIAFNSNGHVSLIPRDAKASIKTQIYDWPYIQYHNNTNMVQKPQDIVFISYDEENAEDNWKKLRSICPRAKRVHGVVGLVAALKAAADKSLTPYFYAVFGKTEVVTDFNFNFCPDYLRRPANYVFQSYNPILDHSYGHDGVVMYDRDWLLGLADWDLDLTMSHAVVTIPVVSCVNRLDASSWSAWRTAFREAYKLSYYLSKRPSIEDEYHLHLWLTRDNTDAGKWSKLGAAQGRQFYLDQTEKQDYAVNDWAWLKEKFQECSLP
jgi:hypothetical protein